MELSDLLNKFIFPAFIVQNGQITHANISALERNIEVGSQITDLISVGNEEYREFTQGKLCLTLNLGGISYNTNVSAMDNAHLFSLETEYDNPQLRTLALAAQQLREPLANAFAGTELLFDAVTENEESKAQLAQVNRSLHQLLRMVSNMSDAALYNAEQLRNIETVELIAAFDEILEKTSALAEKANRKLTYMLPNQSVFSLADRQKLERAILNMLSNALRFSPADSEIYVNIKAVKTRVYFTVQNKLTQAFANEPFFRYLREPGLEFSQSGIGLGLSIVRSAAASHGGTLLMELPEEDTVRFTLSLAITNSNATKLRSPVQFPTDYAGGKDRALLELSDVLPNQLYSETD